MMQHLPILQVLLPAAGRAAGGAVARPRYGLGFGLFR